MSRWVTVLGVGVVALAGCGGGHATAYTGASGLHGVVMRGPTQPVCRRGVPCSEPAAGTTLRFVHNGHLAASAHAGKNGAYSIRLAPGIYTVVSAPQSNIGTGVRPGRVRVVSGAPRRLDFFIDTGIR